MTSPDMVVGATMVAVSVAGFAVGLVATRWTLQRQANLEAARADIDDLVKVAAAAGVYVGHADVREGIQVIDTTGVPAGVEPPSAALIQQTSGPGGAPGAVAAATGSEPTTPGSELDHDVCDDCGRTICLCNQGPEPPLCPGAVEQGCRHGRSLCLTCMAACPECLADLRSQGVLSQYVPDWWNR